VFYRIIRDTIEEKNLRFQVAMFRWHSLYSETTKETNVEYMKNLVRKLNDVLDSNKKIYSKTKL